MHPQSQANCSQWGGCDARLPFRQFFDSSRTKLNKCQWHHFECAQEERAAFLYVFMKAEQKKSGKIACFAGAQKQSCGLRCATPVSSTKKKNKEDNADTLFGGERCAFALRTHFEVGCTNRAISTKYVSIFWRGGCNARK